jgi:sulfite dehydrogenase
VSAPATRRRLAVRVAAMLAVAAALPVAGVEPGREPEAAPGEGRDVFVARCSSCHSLDYVEMHARLGTRALWEAEIAKMRNAFKAPLSDEEARQILDYLERQYGPR